MALWLSALQLNLPEVCRYKKKTETGATGSERRLFFLFVQVHTWGAGLWWWWWWAGPILFEDVLKDGTLVGLELLDGLLELLAALVPLVDAGQQVLLLHPPAHDQVLVAQVVQLLARAVGAVLQVQHQRLEVLLLQAARLQHFLPLLQDHPPVAVLPTHLLDLGLQGCRGGGERGGEGEL